MARPRDAWQAALAALGRRALSVAELAERLERHGFPGPEVRDALARAAAERLVDDRTLAYNLARDRAEAGRRGPLRVRAELLGRGIAAEIADEALALHFDAEATERALRRALDRLLRAAALPADPAERDRLARRLLRAGFAGAQVRRILNGPAGDDDPFTGSA